jgi:hypothetical protein
MNKLAVFVEGYTEVVFVEKLVEEIAGKQKVRIEHREIRGGGAKSGNRRTFAQVKAAQPQTGQKYYVLIVDCGGDRLVKTRIREEHENLDRSGYQKIIGLRDVRPEFSHSDISKLRMDLPRYIKTSLIPVEWVLAILEIESWFLSEATHFARINPAITATAIQEALGFNPETDPMEQRQRPADDLSNCYKIGGQVYQKGCASTTVYALDFASIYLDMARKNEDLNRLCTSTSAFLQS